MSSMVTDDLRARAEAAVRMTRQDIAALPKTDVQRIIHELQVHQVELQMQQEALLVTQQDLEASRAQFEELFDFAPMGYIIVDASGCVLRANAAAESMLNRTGSRVVGQRLQAFIDPKALGLFERALARERAGCEVPLYSTLAEARHVRLELSALPSRPSEHLIALIDVSERTHSVHALERLNEDLEARVLARTSELAARNRELEAEISIRIDRERERQVLEARLRDAERFRSLGVLAGGIAHDFNNLLAAVLGNAELMQLAPDLASSCHEPLSVIKRACRQASDLTRQLLTFAGKGRPAMTTNKLPKIVADNLELLRTGLPSGLQLQTQITTALPEIQADRSQLNQVVTNLVVNAIEAVDGSGTIVVRTRLENIDDEMLSEFYHDERTRPGSFVVLTVQDSGPGIDAETLPRIFDPFFTTKFAGRGLGLATVLGIVQSHRGALRVRSAVGDGTTFDVGFPAAEPRRQSERPPAGAVHDWKGSGPILVVDDDDGVRRVIAKLLTVIGFEVTEASGGAMAIELFESRLPRFRMVVLDWIMPELSGEQVLRRLRQVDPDVPVILVSGYSPDELGGDDERVVGLQKPMTLAQLRRAARELIEATLPTRH
jgi:two-component system cell cycle sensor histidine kinase/response regulator CckA